MPEPIPTNVKGALKMFDYQFHQVAIFTDHAEEAVKNYKALGFDNWIHDEADLIGYFNGAFVTTKAKMWFNYDIYPGELEFLEYVGPNRHAAEGRDGSQPFISHMSTYVDSVFEASKKIWDEFGMLPYHQFITANNTNPAVAGKKRFIECIYDFRELLGYDIKLIQKVPWVFDAGLWLTFDPAAQYSVAEQKVFSKAGKFAQTPTD